MSWGVHSITRTHLDVIVCRAESMLRCPLADCDPQRLFLALPDFLHRRIARGEKAGAG
jgi:hypothetical protein